MSVIDCAMTVSEQRTLTRAVGRLLCTYPCRGQTAVHRALFHGAYLQQRAEWRATDWTVARLEAQTVGAEQAETQVTTRQDQRVT